MKSIDRLKSLPTPGVLPTDLMPVRRGSIDHKVTAQEMTQGVAELVGPTVDANLLVFKRRIDPFPSRDAFQEQVDTLADGVYTYQIPASAGSGYVQRSVVGGVAQNDELYVDVRLRGVAEMCALPFPQIPAGRLVVFNVSEYTAGVGGKGGEFEWDPNSIEAHNGVTVFELSSYPIVGRIKRKNPTWDVSEAGVVYVPNPRLAGVPDSTAAWQRAEDAAKPGTTLTITGSSLVTNEILYSGAVTHKGERGCVTYMGPNSNSPFGVFVPRAYRTTTQAEFQTVANANKQRVKFDSVETDGGLTNGQTVGHGIVLTSSEGVVTHCKIYNSPDYGVYLTCFNQFGHTTTDGYNFLQNRIERNRIHGSGRGGIRTVDNDSQTTDGWAEANSITGGSEWGIYIDAAQGWRIYGNQTSSTLHGIGCGKSNTVEVGGNVVRAFGAKTTTGVRYGIYLGGLTENRADGGCSWNSITAQSNSSALGDASTQYIAIAFYGRTGGTSNKHIVISNNTCTFNGFSSAVGKSIGIAQITNVSNAMRGSIVGNTFASDQNEDGSMTDSAIQLHSTARFELAANCNGPMAAFATGPNRPIDYTWSDYKTGNTNNTAAPMFELVHQVALWGTLELEVIVAPSDSEGYANRSAKFLFALRAHSSSINAVATPMRTLTDPTGITADSAIEAIPAAVAASTDATAAQLASVNTALTSIRRNISDLASISNANAIRSANGGSQSTSVRSISEPVVAVPVVVPLSIWPTVLANVLGDNYASTAALFSYQYKARFFGRGLIGVRQ